MPPLDSRSLAYTDTYTHRLPSPGTVTYHLTHAALACAPVPPERFSIDVTPPTGAEPRQHTVTVGFSHDRLVAEPAEFSAAEGDVVLWVAAEPDTPAFAVTGEGDGGFTFASAAMNGGCAFSHVFIQPGDYRWVGATGGGLQGVVHVAAVDFADPASCRAWRDRLSEGVLITIDQDTAEPAEVQIVAGQTVMWAVVAGDGVAIVDTTA